MKKFHQSEPNVLFPVYLTSQDKQLWKKRSLSWIQTWIAWVPNTRSNSASSRYLLRTMSMQRKGKRSLWETGRYSTFLSMCISSNLYWRGVEGRGRGLGCDIVIQCFIDISLLCNGYGAKFEFCGAAGGFKNG